MCIVFTILKNIDWTEVFQEKNFENSYFWFVNISYFFWMIG